MIMNFLKKVPAGKRYDGSAFDWGNFKYVLFVGT